MRTRQDRPRLGAQEALGVIVLCVIVAIACIAALAWVLFPHPADALTCTLAVPALPVAEPLRRWWLRWRMWRNGRRMVEIERQMAQYRRLVADDQRKLECLRDDLSAAQRRQLVLASEQ